MELNIKHKKKLISKIIFILIIISLSVASYVSYNRFKYKNNLKSFKSLILSHNYDKAKEIYDKTNKNKFNNEDINLFFHSIVNETRDKYLSEKLDKKDALILLNELCYYNINNDNINKVKQEIENISNSKNLFESAKKAMNDNNFKYSLELLSCISKDYPNYEEVKTLNNEVYSKYKKYILSSSEACFNKKDFNGAIKIIQDNSKGFENDKDIQTKLEFYKAENLQAANKNKSNKTISNSKTNTSEPTSNEPFDIKNDQEKFINELNIASNSSYLAWVSTNEQNTYIFKGYKNHWRLINTFPCSTGRSGHETPKGKFRISSRGTWFFSPKYQQGGKYWVQFYGNYLFHSLPMDENRNVVDSTLGIPSSHGCVRLNVEDSRWIYNNLPNGTTVLVK